jgi:hypothetical protein
MERMIHRAVFWFSLVALSSIAIFLATSRSEVAVGDDLRHLLTKLAKPPTKEEWEQKQRQQILERWHQIALDLGELVKGGTLDGEMSVKAAIEALGRMDTGDVR